MRSCSDSDMLRRLINCHIIIIIFFLILPLVVKIPGVIIIIIIIIIHKIHCKGKGKGISFV